MATNELLETYLNDHLAGATSGLDLARRLAEETEGTPAGAAMRQLADDIEADRTVLEDLVGRLGFEQHTVKQAAAWMAEKASRLRLDRVSAGSDALALLLSMETLSMGVDGKRNLWHSLQEIAVDVPLLAGLDLAALVERADSQHAVLENCRRDAAPTALGCR